MGATVTVSRRASAFTTPTGQVIYGLFETTYEKNVYPHHPEESCVALGTIQQVIAWIFLGMASAAGGMLQGARGALTPLGYLRSWKQALAKPQILEDRTIRLQVSKSWQASIPIDEERPQRSTDALAAIRACGRDDLADSLAAGEQVELSLHADGDLITAVYGDCGGRGLAPWRIIRPYGFGREDATLAPQRNPVRRDLVPNIQVLRLDAPLKRAYGSLPRYLTLVGGFPPYIGTGGMGDFIRLIAIRLEEQTPGLGEAAVEAFKPFDKDDDHPLAHDLTRITISRPSDRWKRESFDKLAVALASVGCVAGDAEQLAFTLGNLRVYDAKHPDEGRVFGWLDYLDSVSKFDFAPPSQESPSETMLNVARGETGDLFAQAA